MNANGTYVIAGASLGGAKAAEALRRLRRPAHADRRGEEPLCEQPPLSKGYLLAPPLVLF